MDRYTGKPFLKLLECYILDSIEQLDDASRLSLQKMEPKLQGVYGVKGTWLDIVSAQMDFPASFPEQIKQIWSSFLGHARTQGLAVDPNEFAKKFVDENFPDI